jgi:transposase-like protein
MARKNYTAEQIIGMLREAEVRLSQGEKIGGICRGLSVSEQSYYRWRREYGGLKVPQKQPKRGRLWLNDGSCVGVSGFPCVSGRLNITPPWP